ncbi:MAG: ATP-binding protein, partial [Spirochaetaceae bacterium]|nr:ATP-binding protein [Spirochaetaceae bacterium]
MNPFIYGEIAKYPDFCDRPVKLDNLRRNIESGYKTVLIGERRTGKTSLIFEAVRENPGSHLLYAQFWGVRNLIDIVNRLLAGLSTYQNDNSFFEKVIRTLAYLKPEIGLSPDTGSPILSIPAGTAIHIDSLSGIFAAISQQTKKQQLIIAMDEFQDILRVDGADVILGELRGFIQQESRIPYIFAGSIRHEMEQIFHKPGAPFYKSIQTVETGPLPEDKYNQYLIDRFNKGGRRVNNRIIEIIFDISQQNPGDIQQYCAAIWDTT